MKYAMLIYPKSGSHEELTEDEYSSVNAEYWALREDSRCLGGGLWPQQRVEHDEPEEEESGYEARRKKLIERVEHAPPECQNEKGIVQADQTDEQRQRPPLLCEIEQEPRNAEFTFRPPHLSPIR